MKRSAAAIGALLLFFGCASAEEFRRSGALEPVLDVYADWLATSTSLALACSNDDAVRTDVDEARAMFIGSLWASGIPAASVHAWIEQLGETATVECEGYPADQSLTPPGGEWRKSVSRVIAALGLTLVEHPAGAEQFARIKGVFAEELPLQARMLECVAVSDPAVLPIVVRDWEDIVATVVVQMSAAGLPRDEVTSLAQSAAVQTLWQQATEDNETALRESCAADTVWQARFATFGTFRLKSEVGRTLGVTP